jgi:(p)ppGpp synthase/HD superfamily hydrolase
MSHLLGVSSIVLDDGGTEDEAIAALLHDAAEDHGGRARLEDIRSRFGDAVAKIVEDCTDSWDTPKLPWAERKRAYAETRTHVIGVEPARLSGRQGPQRVRNPSRSSE